MSSTLKFYKCLVCGKVIEILHNDCCPTVCCNKEMVLLKANTTDAALEKHVPIVNFNKNIIHVEVGSTLHPMSEEHLIKFIVLETTKGIHRVDLTPTSKPIADFILFPDEKPIAVYEYCNLHGLWVKEI